MSEEKKKILVLIDGHALVHRAYHALPPLSTPKGELVNAVYGFILILLKVLRELKPEYLVATFDVAAPTFRHKEFKEYQVTRTKAPDELYAQISRVKGVLKAFNVPIFEKEGFEADDIIGTLSEKIKKIHDPGETKGTGIKTIIVTGDLDTLQLVDDDVSVFTLKKGVRDTIMYDEAGVRGRFGVEPNQVADFKGLKGDPSDNIPGVPGIGDKTAAELLKQYGSIENLYLELEKQKEKKSKAKLKNLKLADKLLEHKEQAFFSKYLATIKRDVPVDFALKDAVAQDFDREKVITLFKELGFYSLIDRLAGLAEDQKSEEKKVKAIGSVPERKDDLAYERIEQACAQGILSKNIYELEKELAPIIRQMEKIGIKIDVDFLAGLGQGADKKIAQLEEEIYRLAGISFNINSSQQLSEILFVRLGIKTKGLKKTPGKVISTAAPELEKLRGQHEIIGLISEYREVMKLKTTYIDALPKLIAADGRLHTSYDQLGATTGRLTSKNPNLQNIPIKTELGREIRKAFVADDGFKILSADYSQIELRVVAAMAKDKNMLGAFRENQDIHSLTAAEVFEVALKEVTPQMRQTAKVLNFGVIYGMSVHGFAQAAGVEADKAKIFIKKYFEKFYGVAGYIDRIKNQAAKDGYVQTLFGRKRFIPEINSSAWNLKQAAERMAINMPIQGTAADLMKMAMRDINRKVKDKKVKMLLQVHDELIFEVPQETVQAVAKEIKTIMENVYDLGVPLEVDILAGDNWGDLKGVFDL